jgi:hypothetical protein
MPSRIRCVSALLFAAGLGSAALAGDSLRWNLRATVPIVCAVLKVYAPTDRPDSLSITTTCNTQRFQLVLNDGTNQAVLRAAHCSAGPVQFSGNVITVNSNRPGNAVTNIELASAVNAREFVVSLYPAQ